MKASLKRHWFWGCSRGKKTSKAFRRWILGGRISGKKHMKHTWSTIAPTAYHLKPYYSPVPKHRDFVLQHYPHFLKSKTQPSFYLDQWHDAGNNTNKNRTLRMALNSSGTKKPLNFFVPQLLVVVVSSPRRNLDKVVILNPSDVYSLNRDCNNHFKPKKLEKPCITKGQYLSIFRDDFPM